MKVTVSITVELPDGDVSSCSRVATRDGMEIDPEAIGTAIAACIMGSDCPRPTEVLAEAIDTVNDAGGLDDEDDARAMADAAAKIIERWRLHDAAMDAP